MEPEGAKGNETRDGWFPRDGKTLTPERSESEKATEGAAHSEWSERGANKHAPEWKR